MRREKFDSYILLLYFCTMCSCLTEGSNAEVYQSYGQCTSMPLPAPPPPPALSIPLAPPEEDYETVDEYEESDRYIRNRDLVPEQEEATPVPNYDWKVTCEGVNLTQTTPIQHCMKCQKLIYRESHISKIQTNLIQSAYHLQEVHLADTSIQKIETGAFANLPNLTVLNLAMNKLTTVNRGTFNSLINLRSLNLSHNVISAIEEEAFHGSSSIEILDLSQNKISALPKDLFLHLNLISLNISNNLLTEIGDVFCDSIPKLTSLMMNHNLLDSIPDCLHGSIITDLSFSFNSISDFNSSLLPSGLETFAISNNDLHHIHEESFRSLTYLKSMDISDNSLDIFNPKSLEDLRNLRILKIAGNNIRTMGAKLFKSTPLLELRIGRNNITVLQKRTFQHLHGLKMLDLSENNIDFIQLDVLKDLVFLEVLNISHNKIEYLQSGVFNGMMMMKHLDLSFNSIESLHSHIFQPLSSLSVLDLKFNQLKTVDVEDLPLYCRNLRSLALDGNNFSCISLGRITSYFQRRGIYLESGKTILSENINGISCHEHVEGETETNDKDSLIQMKSFFENDFKKTSFYNFFKNFTGRNPKDVTEQNLTNLTRVIEILQSNFSTGLSKNLNLNVKEFMNFENISLQNFSKELAIIGQRLEDNQRQHKKLSTDDLSSSLHNEINTLVNFENSSFINFISKLSEIIDKMDENQSRSEEIPGIINKLQKISAEKLVSTEETKGTTELISAINQLKGFIILCTFIALLLVIANKIFPHIKRKYFGAKHVEHNQEMPILT